MSQLVICAKSHKRIIYDSNEHDSCPLCQALVDNEILIDARTDIDEADIFDLYGELKLLTRRVLRIEKLLGLAPLKKHWWSSSNEIVRTSARPTLPEAQF